MIDAGMEPFRMIKKPFLVDDLRAVSKTDMASKSKAHSYALLIVVRHLIMVMEYGHNSGEGISPA